MHIVELQIENVKRILAVDITPDGHIVEIAGENGEGKSSVLDAIMYTLAGQSACPGEPVRHGENSAISRVNLGDFEITRTWTEKGSYLKVLDADGCTVKAPQKMLETMFGTLTFDPLEFSRMDRHKQRETLLSLLGVGDRLRGLDRDEESARERRKDEKKNLKQVEAEIKAAPPVPGDLPDKPISVADLSNRLTVATEQKSQITAAEHQLAQQHERLRILGEKVAELENEIGKKRNEMQAVTTWTDQEVKRISDLKAALPDIEAIRAEFDRVEPINKAIQQREALELLKAKRETIRKAVAEAEAYIESSQQSRAEILRSAEWPVPGLSVDDETVRMNNVPLDQCSSAELIRICAAIAMKMNPTLRVMLVRDGSLLDDDSLDELYKLVQENDYQLWIERVGEGSESAIVIEDGGIKNRQIPAPLPKSA